MLETYRRQIVDWKLENYVEFVGYISDEQRNALMEGCEMAVIPSLYEPFGIVALETMSLGKPTIVSNTGGMKGIVKHLQTGLLMVPGNAHSLQEQIDYLLKNPLAAKAIGGRGRQIVISLYGWKRVATETMRVMEDSLLFKRVQGIKEIETPNTL
jgi:1,4-alpha-glucan branching enzyme